MVYTWYMYVCTRKILLKRVVTKPPKGRPEYVYILYIHTHCIMMMEKESGARRTRYSIYIYIIISTWRCVWCVYASVRARPYSEKSNTLLSRLSRRRPSQSLKAPSVVHMCIYICIYYKGITCTRVRINVYVHI